VKLNKAIFDDKIVKEIFLKESYVTEEDIRNADKFAKTHQGSFVEYLLQEKLITKDLFTGSGNLAFSQGSCSYTVTNQGGQNRTIILSGTVGTIIRKVKIIINKINPLIILTSWQEVNNF